MTNYLDMFTELDKWIWAQRFSEEAAAKFQR
jgi:hypothetical protein